jgi:hypothetical protein
MPALLSFVFQVCPSSPGLAWSGANFRKRHWLEMAGEVEVEDEIGALPKALPDQSNFV